jgi:hypothetical protein
MDRDPSGTYASTGPDPVGYSEALARELHESSGLPVVEPLHHGYRRFQDVIVAVKPSDGTSG